MLKIAVRKSSAGLGEAGPGRSPQSEARPLSAKGEARKKTAVSWWTPLACGRRSFVRVGDSVMGSRCGSRSCFSCARNKLERFGNIATHLKREPGEVFRSIVVTPTDSRKTRTRKDISDFFASFRKMLRSWNRSAGLGYAFWTAEGVVKWDEQGTIPCPLRETAPPDEWLYNSSAELTAEVETLRQQCHDGNCKFCGGSGYLPAVHLHIHLLTSTKPFYYGDGQSDTTLAAMHPDGKGGYTGLQGFCKRFGLFSRVEKVRDVNHLQKYLSKAMVRYTTKAATNGKGKIDHEGSALEQAVVSWTIGHNRSRGAVGRAYGLSSRTKNISTSVLMTDERNPTRNPLSYALSNEEYTPPPRAPEEHAVLVDTLTIGKGSPLQDYINVLKKTQVDTEWKLQQPDENQITTKGFRDFWGRWPSPDGYDLESYWATFDKVWTLDTVYQRAKNKPRLTQVVQKIEPNEMLSNYWHGVVVVDDKMPWFKMTPEGSIFGLGGSMVSKQCGYSPKMVIEALKAIQGLPYRFWSLYLDELSRRESIYRGGYDRTENREMA